MGKVKNSLKIPIYGRLFITFLLIMIPIYSIGLSIYYLGSDAIQNEVYTSMLSKEKFIMDKMESEVQKLEILQDYCLKDRNVLNLSNINEIMSDEEKYQAILNVENKLNTIYLSSSLIKDVVLYFPSIQKQYSTYKHGTGDINEKQYDLMKFLYQNNGPKFVFQDQGIYLIHTYPPEYLPGSKKFSVDSSQCLLGIEISPDLLLQPFNQLSPYNKNDFILINTENGYKITGSRDKTLSTAIYQSAGILSEKNANHVNHVNVKGISYITFYTSSDYLHLGVLRYIPKDEVYRQLDFYSILLWVFLAISVIIIIIYSISTYNFIQIPLKKLIHSFTAVGKGDLKVSIKPMYNDEFKYLYQRFNEMVIQIDSLINQTYKQKILLQKSELKQLQTQINPHFLYNSFFILERMIKSEDYENSLDFVDHLGNYFQFITRNASEEIPLKKEIFHAHTYSEIQSVRFGDRIQIIFENLPEQFSDLKVPRLILQPLIENSIVHGFKNKETDCIIHLSYRNEENFLYIMVNDNGAGIGDEKLEKLNQILEKNNTEIEVESTAVININSRVRMTFGQESGLILHRNSMGGLCAGILIKLGDI